MRTLHFDFERNLSSNKQLSEAMASIIFVSMLWDLIVFYGSGGIWAGGAINPFEY